jgi:signal transduction histidine kinase
METLPGIQQQILRSRRLPLLIVALVLGVFGTTIYFGTVRLRKGIQSQLVQRDADILYAVAQMQQLHNQEEGTELGGEIEHLSVALESSQLPDLKGVIAMRLFDPQGKFTLSLPLHIPPATLSASDLTHLKALRPGSRFYPDASVAPFFPPTGRDAAPSAAAKTAPLLEINIPLHRKDQSELLGAAQFIIDGESIANEFAALDRSLALQAGGVFAAGGFITVCVLLWAFRRLQTAGRLVMERTEKLLRANEELALAARTSAVGAVTAHLIHGLSNPLSGLHDFVTTGRARSPQSDPDENELDWDDAAASADQMQRLIAESIRLLGEEQAFDRYEITFAELAEVVAGKVRTMAERAGVGFTSIVKADGILPNREANLIVLILENLIRNAIEATPSGKNVALTVYRLDAQVVYELRDEGSGIPKSLRENLFVPCRSRKAGGHGIGLAICKQLANHLGAALELRSSTPSGSTFALAVPVPALTEQPCLPGVLR